MEPQQPSKPAGEQPGQSEPPSPMPPPPYDDNGLPANDNAPEPSEPQPGHRYDHLMPKKESHKGRTALIIATILIVLGGLVAGAYFLFLKSDPKTDGSKQPDTSEQAGNEENKDEAMPPSGETAAGTLKSTKLNLEVTKPAGWLGQEDPASGELTLTSPETTYAATSGSKTGVFVLKVRQGADTDGQAAIKNSNAVEASETIAYSAPTESQRHFTNITVAGTNENASFLIVTSADTFKKGEAMARFFINGDVYVIVGGFREATKTGLMGYDLMPKATFIGSEEYEAAVGVIKSLKIF